MKEVDDLQIPLKEQVFHERQTFLGVDGMKRLPAIFGFRNDDVKPGGKGDQVTEEGLVEKRHVTCRDKGIRVSGVEESRKDTPQGSLFLIKIGNDPQVQVQIFKGRVGDEEDLVKEIDEDTRGAVDDPLTMDLEEGFILPHAKVLAPRQDDSSRFDQGFNRNFD
jgi:hypothetical protein